LGEMHPEPALFFHEDSENERDKKIQDILTNLHEFDYVKFVTPDLHNIARGKLVPVRHVKNYLHDGYSVSMVWSIIGSNGNVLFKEMDGLRALEGQREVGNFIMQPCPSTWRHAGWCSIPRVAEITCELRFPDGRVDPGSIRNLARQQLRRLEEKGLHILSGTEMEFILRKEKNPIWTPVQMMSFQLLSKALPFLTEVEKSLLKAGIDVTSIEAEHAAGQLEINYKPVWGIKGADWPSIIKTALKEAAQKEKLEANFMSRMSSLTGESADECGNGAHFNHSIWDKNQETNLCYDENSQQKVSTLTQNWVAGIITHLPALSALYSPTVNCYRRQKGPMGFKTTSYGIDNRFKSVRIKNYGPKSSCIEMRGPSGLSNPYLVMAGTVAAGLDGLERNLELPLPQPEGTVKELPDSLEAALVALEEDTVLKDALGTDWVEWFVRMKRKGEVEKLQSDSLEEEIKMYAEFC